MKLQIILGILRHFLTIGGGYLVQQGYTNQDGATQAVGAVLTLIGLGWSITHKVKNESVAPGQAQGVLGGAACPAPSGVNVTSGQSPNLLPLLLLCGLCASVVNAGTPTDGGLGQPALPTTSPAPSGASAATNAPNESLLSLLISTVTNTAAQAASPALDIHVNPKMAQAVDTVTWMQAVGRTTTIGGVYTVLANGEYGGGVAVAWQPIHIDVKARTRILLGPSLVTASTHYATRELLEAALETKVIDAAAVQAAFKSIPCIGQLPLDVSQVQIFAGFGLRVDADTSSIHALERYIGGSVGLTGIKWGN